MEEEKQFDLDLDFEESPEKKLFGWLSRNASGLANAKKAAEIEMALGFSPRQIAEIKSRAVITFKLQIGSTTSGGYFLPQNQEEREIGGRELRAKAKSILAQFAAYQKITKKEAAKEIMNDFFEGGSDG